MRDWIVGLQKGAIEHRAGVTMDEWSAALRDAGTDAPDELRDFFLQVNGATFASGVVIYPLRGTGEVKGVLEQSRTGAAGFPTQDVWRIGRRDQEHLAAIRKGRLAEIEAPNRTAPPDWLMDADDHRWVYVARDEATNGLRIYPNLELLLTSRIPPAEAEEFGERTFARALSLVEDTLEGIGEVADAKGSVAATRKTATPAKRGQSKRATAAKKNDSASVRRSGSKRSTAAAKKKPVSTKRGGSKNATAAKQRKPASTKRGGSKNATAAKQRMPASTKRGGSKNATAAKLRKPASTKRRASKRSSAARKLKPAASAKRSASPKKRKPAPSTKRGTPKRKR